MLATMSLSKPAQAAHSLPVPLLPSRFHKTRQAQALSLSLHSQYKRQQPFICNARSRIAETAEVNREAETPSTSYSYSLPGSPAPLRQSSAAEGFLQDLLGKLLKSAAIGALCVGLAFMCAAPALAAGSGGRMGGSAFSSRGSMGGSFGGAHSSLGGGSSGGGSFGSSLPLRNSPLTARRSPSVSINSFGWYGPPVPFYGGGYSSGYGVAPVSGGGGFGTIILLGVIAAILWSMFTSSPDSDNGPAAGERMSVAKLQVGLLGSARQMQKDLERIAKRADTNTPSGLHYVLQETVLGLLRNPDYCVYGAAQTSNKRGLAAAEAKFNELSMEERSKFKEETLVNFGGRTRNSTYTKNSSGQGMRELIVVTIIVAVEGGIKLPNVTSLEELRTALNRLGSISAEQTCAVEVLWTPQDEDDYLTKDEIFQDYPTLNNL